ncbi:MAG: dihydropyrimidinase [Alphaproteobacteria bacterium]|nr:dihydropyrimidinase [Alphaproteobacteria bacterium]
MADFDLVIRGGTVATAGDTAPCDVGVRGGRIAALGADLGKGTREIDARGRLVLPGGIDSHCHIAQASSFGLRTADDFASGSLSALMGGTTTFIPFACQHRGQSLRQVVEDYHAEARGKSYIDYAYHLIVSDPTPSVLGQDLPVLIRDGFTSFKIYMTYERLRLDDRQVLEVLDLARRERALVMIHAENHDVIQWLTEKLLAAGRSAPKYHAVAHTPQAEREATHRAITLAEIAGVPVLIVHVSAAAAIEQIRWARAEGLAVHGETCPQYLFLTAADLDRPGFEGAKYMCSPPPREAANQDHVWRALIDGTLDVYSSDHAPYRYDVTGKLAKGPDAPFKTVANGVPGLELRLPLLFSEGVVTGRMTLERFVAVTATNHAKLYGLYPRKGTITPGADADIAIWDPARVVTVTAALLHDNVGYTPYEGRRVTGWPVTVIAGGAIVADEGKVLAEPGRGQFLPCGVPGPLARMTEAS